MEEQCSPLGWAYFYQEEGVDVLKQSLLYSTLELEAAVVSAHDEILRKDDEILRLKALLSKIIKERDELQANSLEKQLLFQQLQILAEQQPISSANDQDDDNAAASGCSKDTLPLITPPPLVLDVTDIVALKRPLPEQGKFHQAVMEAGPLLQTLLLAGPLPRWQHPPPQLNSIDIPPVTISSPPNSCLVISPTSSSGGLTNKRGMISRDAASSKYQKVCSPTSTS